jgi:hypothetical protein
VSWLLMVRAALACIALGLELLSGSKGTDSVEDARPEILILRDPLVAHALMRAVFALLRTPVATESQAFTGA